MALGMPLAFWPRQNPETRQRKLTGIWNSQAVGQHSQYNMHATGIVYYYCCLLYTSDAADEMD